MPIHLARYRERIAARREAAELVRRYGERACGLALDWLDTLPEHERGYSRLVVIAVAQRQGCRAPWDWR